MYKNEIQDFLCSGLFCETKILKQHWKQNRYSYRNNPRPDYGLMLLTHGEVNFASENNTVAAKPGDVVFLPKFSRYEAIFENTADDYLVNFDIVGNEIHIPEPTVLFSGASVGCHDAYATLVKEHISPQRTSLRVRGLFHLVLDSIVANMCRNDAPERSLAEKAAELLRSDYDLSIGQIAKKYGISESGFRRIFKDTTGLSPVAYRLQYKLTRAEYLLESTDMSIAEVAESLHFYDAAYFCKSFKAFTGLSPKQYIKSRQL